MNNNISLVIDATSTKTYLHLIVNNQIVKTDQYTNNNDLSFKLAVYIKNILETNKLVVKDIQNLYLVYGPGKFSAMRIGSVVAKTITMLNKSKLFIIDKFDYFNTKNCIVIIESDGKKYFKCEYKNNKKAEQPVLISEQELKQLKKNCKEQLVYESDNTNNILSKLKSFKEVDENFELEYLKKPC